MKYALAAISLKYAPVIGFLHLILCVGALIPTTTTSVQNAPSATISWALQRFSLPVNHYTYSLSRRSSQILCTDTRPVVATNEVSVTFTDLQGFSNYRFTLTAAFDSFGTEESAVTTTDFMTPSAGRFNRFHVSRIRRV